MNFYKFRPRDFELYMNDDGETYSCLKFNVDLIPDIIFLAINSL